jgi:hypothetical protein
LHQTPLQGRLLELVIGIVEVFGSDDAAESLGFMEFVDSPIAGIDFFVCKALRRE